jgi:acetyl esterase/lipase
VVNSETIAWIAAIIWTAANLWTLLFAVHAYKPIRSQRVGLVFGFFSSWITLELAPHFVFTHLALGGIAVLFGAMTVEAGWVGLVSGVVVVSVLAHHWLEGRGAAQAMKEALAEPLGDEPWPRVPKTKFINPFWPQREGVSVERDVEFARVQGRKLKLDVYKPSGSSDQRRPAIVQVHGGVWMMGDKKEQGLPLLYHLASHGWVGFNVNYRLSPAATFPDHLVDVKRAIAWIREHAYEYNIDPNFIAITGGSAGGHLSSLVALTYDDPKYQPGFEDADTSVNAVVPFYAVFDFVDRLNLLGPAFRKRILERHIMKKFFDDEPEAFHEASPVDHVRPDAPPFFVIHGDRDTLAPVEYARMFVEKMRETSENPVYYAEISGAQHAFDIFISPRTARVIAGTERFLDNTWNQYLENRVTEDELITQSGDAAQ